MAKRKEGVYERIVECARKEFIDKGYKDASLRTIAADAGTSTNSIYVRFGDKEGLFTAIVDPTKEEFINKYINIQDGFTDKNPDDQRAQMILYSTDGMIELLDYIYDHFDDFKLLLDASYGTKHSDFVHEISVLETSYTYKYFDAIGYKVRDTGGTEELIHMVNTSFFEGVFEVIRHGMEYKEAKEYVDSLVKYHHAGFREVFS